MGVKRRMRAQYWKNWGSTDPLDPVAPVTGGALSIFPTPCQLLPV